MITSFSGRWAFHVAKLLLSIYGLWTRMNFWGSTQWWVSSCLVKVIFSPVFVDWSSISIASYGTPSSRALVAYFLASGSFRSILLLRQYHQENTIKGAYHSRNNCAHRSAVLISMLHNTTIQSAGARRWCMWWYSHNTSARWSIVLSIIYFSWFIEIK